MGGLGGQARPLQCPFAGGEAGLMEGGWQEVADEPVTPQAKGIAGAVPGEMEKAVDRSGVLSEITHMARHGESEQGT